MKTLCLFVISVCVMVLALPLHAKETAKSLYQENCASCHGKTLEGGMAGSLLDDEWLQNGEPSTLATIIKHGLTEAGMPAWQSSLTDADIRGLVIYIDEQRHKANRVNTAAVADALRFSAQGYDIQMRTVTEFDELIWAVEPLGNGELLVTQRNGVLWHFDGARSHKINAIPEVWDKGQGGLMDVALHPDYNNNGWVYLAFSHEINGKAMTKIVRGKIEKQRWQQQQTIFQVDEKRYTGSRYHFGSRMVFKDGYLYFGVGDRGAKNRAQDLAWPNGKVFRLHEDGRIPADNPFVNTKQALPEIWSYGHRNPQGMAFDKNTAWVWASEHGPRGGDEMNTLSAGRNYGWPVITYGMNYNGTPITHLTAKEGMEQPQHYWVPSIAVAGVDFYDGDQFKNWQGKLLVTGMKTQTLHLLDINGTEVVADNVLLAGQGRLRDVRVASDGSIVLAANRDGKGRILQLLPAD